MREKQVSITLLGHEIVLQHVVADVAGAVKWGKDYIKDAIKDLPYASIIMAGVFLVLPLLKNPVPTRPPTRMDSRTSHRRCGTISPWSALLLPEEMEAGQKDELARRLDRPL